MADYARSLVSCWDMSVPNPPDLGWKGNGNDGTGVGIVAATDVVEGIAGGRAIEFNGIDEHVNMGDVASLDFALSPFTFAVWAKSLDSTPDVMIAKSNGGPFGVGYGYLFIINSSGFIQVFMASSGVNSFQMAGTIDLRDGGWHHLVVVIDRTSNARCFLFVDSVDDTGSRIGTIANVEDISNTVDFILGSESDNAHYFAGILDSVRIYDAALTPLQVRDLYEQTRKGILR